MLSREQFRDIKAMLRPMRTRLDNMVARGVVSLVNATVKMQILQVGIQDNEPVDEIEHFQPYGFKSVPKTGAESIVLFIGGDRGAPVAVVTDDRRTRPVDWEEGETGVYNEDLIARLKDDGTIEIGTRGGTFAELAFKSDVDALAAHVDTHAHTVVGGSSAGQTSPPSTAPATPDPSPSAVGTVILKGE